MCVWGVSAEWDLQRQGMEGQTSCQGCVAKGGTDPSPLPLSEVASLALRFWLGDLSFSYGRGVGERAAPCEAALSSGPQAQALPQTHIDPVEVDAPVSPGPRGDEAVAVLARRGHWGVGWCQGSPNL